MDKPAYLTHEVDSAETVVRAIKSPFHVKKGTQLRRAAFMPPRGRRDLSVIRLRAGAGHCKDMGKRAVSGPDAQYRGLASGGVGYLLSIGAGVDCDQIPFVGHANIILPEVFLSSATEEPPPPEDLEERDNVLKLLLNHFRYFPDPDPEGQGWSGPPLSR